MAVTVTLFLLKTLNCFPWYLAIVLPGYCFLQLFFRSILVFSLLCCMPARLHIPSSSFSSYSGIPECLFYIPSNWQCQHNMTKSLLYFLSSWWWEQRKLQVLYIHKCRDQNMQVCWLGPRVNKLPHAECGDVEISLARRHLQTCPEGTFRYNNVHDAFGIYHISSRKKTLWIPVFHNFKKHNALNKSLNGRNMMIWFLHNIQVQGENITS